MIVNYIKDEKLIDFFDTMYPSDYMFLKFGDNTYVYLSQNNAICRFDSNESLKYHFEQNIPQYTKNIPTPSGIFSYKFFYDFAYIAIINNELDDNQSFHHQTIDPIFFYNNPDFLKKMSSFKTLDGKTLSLDPLITLKEEDGKIKSDFFSSFPYFTRFNFLNKDYKDYVFPVEIMYQMPEVSEVSGTLTFDELSMPADASYYNWNKEEIEPYHKILNAGQFLSSDTSPLNHHKIPNKFPSVWIKPNLPILPGFMRMEEIQELRYSVMKEIQKNSKGQKITENNINSFLSKPYLNILSEFFMEVYKTFEDIFVTHKSYENLKKDFDHLIEIDENIYNKYLLSKSPTAKEDLLK